MIKELLDKDLESKEGPADHLIRVYHEQAIYEFEAEADKSLQEHLLQRGLKLSRQTRILHEGERLDIEDDLTTLPTSAKLVIEQEQVGGGGRVTSGPGRASRGREARIPPCDDLSSNSPYYRGRTLARIGGEEVGIEHGLVRGKYTQLPESTRGNRGIQLQGRIVGLWTIVLGPSTPLNTLTKLLEATYEKYFVFKFNGVEVDTSKTPSEISLLDGQTLEVFNLIQPPPPAEEDPDALRYMIEGSIKELPPPLPGHVRVQLITEDQRTFAATIRADAPFSLIAEHINKECGENLRYVLDGTRIAENMTMEQNDINNEDQIDVHGEMTGGGDTNRVDEEEEYDQDGHYSETNHEPIGIFAVPSPSTTQTVPNNNSTTASSLPPPHSTSSSGYQAHPQVTPAPNVSTPTRRATIPTRSTIDAVGKFKGRHAKAFIRKYEALGARTNASPDDLIQDLSFYVEDVEPDIFSLIEAHSSYIAKDWPGIKRYILTGFEGPDTDKYTEHDLAVFVSTPRSLGTITELNHHSLSFKDMGDKLLQRGQIGSKQYLQYFVRGLPDEVLLSLADSTLEDEHATFQDVLEEVQRFFQPSTFFKKASLEKQRERAQLEHRAPTNGPALHLSLVSGRNGNDKESVMVKQLERISLNFAHAMERAAQPAFAAPRFASSTQGIKMPTQYQHPAPQTFTTNGPTPPSSQ
ncbi:hypothetical protein A4X13_0g7053 [Tilletia indica]|uniref:Ubiquitin-like domain-containing protein n=1 Tax=Tilletia indica TaxID=43049 RepID=A0A177T4W0_9BASI|nr:hypothetical protein A4X13_0g7053 [Tilletia indica]